MKPSALQQNDMDKLREIVGKLEDAAAQAQAGQFNQGAAGASQAPMLPPMRIAALQRIPPASSTEGKEGPDDVVDADFTDKKK
jgi:hypothetical protein